MFAINTPGFLVFAALLVAVWYAVPQKHRWLAMLAANTIFYLSISWQGIFVLLGSTAVVWWAARRAQSSRLHLYIGLAAALGPLLVLKYTAFFAGALGGLLGCTLWAGGSLLQPLGLAYFSLQLAGYLLDVRAARLAPEQSFARLLCYAGFFLSITQGPFNRYNELMPQLDNTPAYSAQRVWRGTMRCAWGCFKKLAVAERLATVTTAVFAAPADFDASQLAVAAVGFTLQLYADFSGYTDIVLGVGEMLGLTLPENFRQPLFACSIKEFWSRWHSSLSRWFRDYLYIPLGGSRKGTARRDINVLLTMLVSGMWHGANWTFLLWGAAHGAVQMAENHLPRSKKQPWPVRFLRGCLTFAFVVAAFTVFRTDSIQDAALYFASLIANPGTAVFARYWEIGLTSRLELLLTLAGPVLVLLVDAAHERGVCLRDKIMVLRLPMRWAVYQGAILLFLLMGRFISSGSGTFLYAKF